MKWDEWLLYAVLIVLCFTIGVLWGSQEAKAAISIPIDSKAALVVNADTNEVLVAKNADTVRSIASITKLMTAIVTLDATLPMDEEITITRADVIATTVNKRPSGTSLTVGTTLTRRELLHLMLMNSQNRAAVALARTYPGGFDACINEMNNKASELGMAHTSFVDPTGLFSQNMSTAQDLVIMVKHAATYPAIQQLSTQTQFTTVVHHQRKDRLASFVTTNRLLKTEGWDIGLQKTGFTAAAGRCMVLLTSMGTDKFVVVLLNTPSPYKRAADAIKIKHWVEAGYIASASQIRSLNPYKTTKKHKTKHKKRVHR